MSMAASAFGKGLMGYMRGVEMRKGDERSEKAAERQKRLDDLTIRQGEANIASTNRRDTLAENRFSFDVRTGERADERADTRLDLDVNQDERADTRLSADIENQNASTNRANRADERAQENHDFEVGSREKAAKDEAARQSIMSGALENAIAAQERGGGPLAKYMATVYAPQVRDGFLALDGDVDRANAWTEFAESAAAKQGLKTWDQARWALESGDWEQALLKMTELYNDEGYIPDGYQVDPEGTAVVRDADDNFMHLALRFRGPDGSTAERVFDSPEDVLREGLSQLAPVTAFNTRYEALNRAEDVRAGRSEAQAKAMNTARDAVAKLIADNAANAINRLNDAELKTEIGKIYETYGLTPDGRFPDQGQPRDTSNVSPFQDMR